MTTGFPPSGGFLALSPAANMSGCAFDPDTHNLYVGPQTASPGLMARVNTDTFTLNGTCNFNTASSLINQRNTLWLNGYAYSTPAGPSAGARLFRVPGNNFIPSAVQALDLSTAPGGLISSANMQFNGACTDGRYIYLTGADATTPRGALIRVDPNNFTASGISVMDITALSGPQPWFISYDPNNKQLFFAVAFHRLAKLNPFHWGNLANIMLGTDMTGLGTREWFFVGRQFVWVGADYVSPYPLIALSKHDLTIVRSFPGENFGVPDTAEAFSDGRRYGYFYCPNWIVVCIDEANPQAFNSIAMTSLDPNFAGNVAGNPAMDNNGFLYYAPSGTPPNVVRFHTVPQRVYAGVSGQP